VVCTVSSLSPTHCRAALAGVAVDPAEHAPIISVSAAEELCTFFAMPIRYDVPSSPYYSPVRLTLLRGLVRDRSVEPRDDKQAGWCLQFDYS
jgi:hypothetical protein